MFTSEVITGVEVTVAVTVKVVLGVGIVMQLQMLEITMMGSVFTFQVDVEVALLALCEDVVADVVLLLRDAASKLQLVVDVVLISS
jgi:hypothetical protein